MIKCLFTERDWRPDGNIWLSVRAYGFPSGPPIHSVSRYYSDLLNSNITSPVPPKIVSDAAVRVEPGGQVSCSAIGTLPIYIALIRNFTVLTNKTDTVRSGKLYQEGTYTCVASSKYGTDVKDFVIKGGEIILNLTLCILNCD